MSPDRSSSDAPSSLRGLTAANCRCSAPSEEGTVQINAACPIHGDGTDYAKAKLEYWIGELQRLTSSVDPSIRSRVPEEQTREHTSRAEETCGDSPRQDPTREG